MNEPFRAAPTLPLLFLPTALICAGRVPRQEEHTPTHGKYQQASPDWMQKALPDQEKNGDLNDQRTDANDGLSRHGASLVFFAVLAQPPCGGRALGASKLAPSRRARLTKPGERTTKSGPEAACRCH